MQELLNIIDYTEYNYLLKKSEGKKWHTGIRTFGEFVIRFVDSLFQYPSELLYSSEQPYPFMIYNVNDWTDNDYGHIADQYYITNYFLQNRFVLIVCKYDLEASWGAFVDESAHYSYRNRVFLFRIHDLATDEVVELPDSPNVLQRHGNMCSTLLTLSKNEDKERRFTLKERVI